MSEENKKPNGNKRVAPYFNEKEEGILNEMAKDNGLSASAMLKRCFFLEARRGGYYRKSGV